MGRIGPTEILVIAVLLVLYTVVVYIIGKKVGYGRALRDVAQGKFPTLTNKNL